MNTPMSHSLPPASEKAQIYKEIIVRQQPGIAEHFNTLTPNERVMCYYLYRAVLPCNLILADQLHRHASAIIDLFKKLHKARNTLEKALGSQFAKEVEMYLIYVATNHGQYFKRDQGANKRTPEALGFTSLTRENIVHAIEAASIELERFSIDDLADSIFNKEYEPHLTVPGSIEASATHFHSPGMTTELFTSTIDPSQRLVHAFYDFNESNIPMVSPSHVDGHYHTELATARFWFSTALSLAQKHPDLFDKYFLRSLKHLINFIDTGDEELFKEHFKEWIKTKSRINYSFGFIETYDDPMETTGSMQGEITIKHVDLDKLSAILPSIEAALPLPDAYKRKNMDVLPNASVNVQLYGTGGLGPLAITLAYCLPNYPDIRSTHGSKQIMYPETKSLAESVNPEKALLFNYSPEQIAWLNKHDPDKRMAKEIRELLTFLHETIGHASGSLASHTFTEQENRTIGTKTYAVGETIPVTNENIAHFLLGYDSTLEELRAEIIALYVATHHLETLVECGFLTEWVDKLGIETVRKWILHAMAYHGIYRLAGQPEENKEILGAHAQANAVITNYLLKNNTAQLTRIPITVDGQQHEAVTLKIDDTEKGMAVTQKLMQLVQNIKSTGDGRAARELIENYGKQIDSPELKKTLINNRKTLIGNLRVFANLYPDLTPLMDPSGNVVDIQAQWPSDICEQIFNEDKRALSTSLLP